ncbi:hypothetical protein [Silvibacterium acidisoli]|uniref:hypothetical protein n=1 Tax=Acidobacteriaceae bacterium ZG23-2 TaxID=2883246 RepID=UPI00406C0F30
MDLATGTSTYQSRSEQQADWSFGSRALFRLVAAFTLLALTLNYSPWSVIPVVGRYMSDAVAKPLQAIAGWLISHVFHVAGIAATQHSTDSRDTAFDWVSMLTVLVLSAVVAIVWSVLDRKKRSLSTQATWLRHITRLMLIFVMVRYGIFKIFPMQMSRPSLGVLNEPVGQSSPMSLLWTLIGLSPAYQILSGVFEALCAVLLCFEKTALPGTLLGIVVMSNVVLFNFCFDVPVKLGALLILFGFIVLLWQDVPTLYSFFSRRGIRLHTRWRPVFKTARLKRLAYGVELFYVMCVIYVLVPPAYTSERREAAHLRSPSSLAGQWHVESATKREGSETVDAPVLTAELLPLTDLYLEPDGRAMARSSDGRLWRSTADIDEAGSSLSLYSYYFDGERFQATYHYSYKDSQHLLLVPVGKDSASESTLILERVALPESYPLLHPHFHWVEEWALER